VIDKRQEIAVLLRSLKALKKARQDWEALDEDSFREAVAKEMGIGRSTLCNWLSENSPKNRIDAYWLVVYCDLLTRHGLAGECCEVIRRIISNPLGLQVSEAGGLGVYRRRP
jgi:hypothetical protein